MSVELDKFFDNEMLHEDMMEIISDSEDDELEDKLIEGYEDPDEKKNPLFDEPL